MAESLYSCRMDGSAGLRELKISAEINSRSCDFEYVRQWLWEKKNGTTILFYIRDYIWFYTKKEYNITVIM